MSCNNRLLSVVIMLHALMLNEITLNYEESPFNTPLPVPPGCPVPPSNDHANEKCVEIQSCPNLPVGCVASTVVCGMVTSVSEKVIAATLVGQCAPPNDNGGCVSYHPFWCGMVQTYTAPNCPIGAEACVEYRGKHGGC